MVQLTNDAAKGRAKGQREAERDVEENANCHPQRRLHEHADGVSRAHESRGHDSTAVEGYVRARGGVSGRKQGQ